MTDSAFDDQDKILPTEDDNPETLAGDPVTFDPEGDDAQGVPVDEAVPQAESGQPSGDAQ